MPLSVILALAALQPGSLVATCAAESNDQQLIQNVNEGVLLHLRIRGQDYSGNKGEAPAVQKPDAYKRLVVRFETCAPIASLSDANRNYVDESRGWVKRLFARKLVGKVLKVNATVNPLGVSSSKPLITMTKDSGKSGDVWLSDVDNDIVLLPYFRTAEDQTVKLDIAFTSTRNYNISAAGTAIDIIKHAATLLNPTGQLVTSLNKDQFNQAADFVDRTISGLLTVSIQEQVHTEGRLRDSSEPLATMTLYAPWANDVFAKARHGMIPLGRWNIYAETLSAESIFELRKKDEKMTDYSAASILNFRVTDDKTLKEAVAGDNEVQRTRDELLSADKGGPTQDAAWAMCRAAALKIDSLGFSADDTGKGVWAYLTDLALPAEKRGDAATACGNLDHWPLPAEIAQTDGKDSKGAPGNVSGGNRRR